MRLSQNNEMIPVALTTKQAALLLHVSDNEVEKGPPDLDLTSTLDRSPE